MGDAVFKNDDESVYKNHILYFLPDDGNCARVVAAVEQHPLGEDVFMQDVRQLRQRPSWLDGVPVLVRRKDGKAFKGQSVMAYLRSWQPEEDDFQPVGSISGGFASFEDGESMFAGERKFASLFSEGMFDMEGEDGAGGGSTSRPGAVRASAATNSAGQGGQPLNEKQRRKQQAEVESSQRAQELLDSRQQQDQRLQARQGSSTAPTARTMFTDDRFAGDAPVSQVQVSRAAYHQQHVQQPQQHGAPYGGGGGAYGGVQYGGGGGYGAAAVPAGPQYAYQAPPGGQYQAPQAQHAYGYQGVPPAAAPAVPAASRGGQGGGYAQGYGAAQGGGYRAPHGHAGPAGYGLQPQPQYHARQPQYQQPQQPQASYYQHQAQGHYGY